MNVKRQLLKDLAEINYIVGRHSGAWETLCDREAFALECLEEMMKYAKAYGVPFKENIKDNFFESDWQDHMKFGIEYAYDELLFELKEKTQEQIIMLIE